MSYTMKLDVFSHDLHIRGGRLERINGSAEVCQRVKIALWHYQGEYFLNRQNGVPYYPNENVGEYIMGSKMSRQTIYNILRQKILSVPGVLQVSDARISRIGRDYYYSCRIVVESNSGIEQTEQIEIQNVSIGA